MKGLKASGLRFPSFWYYFFLGLAMNQIEMEKIAEAFDKNKNGLIDLTEIIAVLKKGQSSRRLTTTTASKSASDSDKIELEVNMLCYY